MTIYRPPPPLKGGTFNHTMAANASQFTPPAGETLLSNTTVDPRCPVNATGALTQRPTAGGSVAVEPNGSYVYTAPNATWSGELGQAAGYGQSAAVQPPWRCSPLACLLAFTAYPLPAL